MESGLERKYGLFTAIAMVIGVVIGSGVFFKAPAILNAAGDLQTGITAWILGGCIMIFCAVSFAIMGAKYQKVSGVVDYAEVAVGSRYAYFVGWFMAVIYCPALTGVLAYVSAVYFCMLTGWLGSPAVVWGVALFFLVMSFLLNTFAPRLAGRWQVSTTIIKLVPLLAMAVFGILFGVRSGTLPENFQQTMGVVTGNPLFTSVVATSFAYEGWIFATSINSELKNPKRDLPLALIFGGLAIIFIYLVYFLGVAGGAPLSELGEQKGVEIAYDRVFGGTMGTLLTGFITVSCLGTLNGLTMGCTRGLYALAVRDQGPAPARLARVSPRFKMPLLSCFFGFLAALLVLCYFMPVDYFGLYGEGFGFFFDISELPIVTSYAIYLPIFLSIMGREKEFSVSRRYIWPGLAILGCLFMVFAAVMKFYQAGLLQYLIYFVVVMALGLILQKGNLSKKIDDALRVE